MLDMKMDKIDGASFVLDKEGLNVARTVGLMGILVVIIALVIVAVCTVIGFVGNTLLQNGILAFEDMTRPGEIIAVIFFGSLVIAGILGAAISATLVQPLRRMTHAVKQLADGDFSYRLEKHGRFTLREVDEFARAFNVAASELASTEMMRAGFISDFSHEFRTPINSLSGFAQLLRDEDLTDEERREYAGIIVEESERLAGLSERILLLSKMEAATILPERTSVDIAEQIRRCVIMMEPRLSAKHVNIDLSLDTSYVQGNSDYLFQLWMNLLDNAVKFSPEGGRVSMALYGGHIEEGCKTPGSQAVVWISDEGCGMDDATRARIFDRFYQGDTSRASAGSGLGLALCKRIVELHGGSIGVQSTPRKGSVFEVRLPLLKGDGTRKQAQ